MSEEAKPWIDQSKVKLEIAPDLSIDVDLTADHLVDLKVSMTEEALLGKEDKLIGEIKALDDRRAALEKTVANRSDSIGKDKEKKLGFLIKALKTAGFEKPKISCSFTAGSTVDGKIMGVIETRICLPGGNVLSAAKKAKAPKDIVSLYREIGEITAKRNVLKGELVKVKADLSNIPRMERSARATLAMRALETTPAGKQLLAKLNLPKLLPGPKD